MNRFLKHSLWVGALAICGLASSRPSLAATGESTAEVTHVPIYQRLKPQWGIHFTSAVPQLGNQKLQGGAPQNSSYVPIHAAFEAQTVTKLGVIGLGPAVGVYPTSASTGSAPGTRPNLVFAWSVGGLARYQMKLSPSQPIIPTVAWHLESWYYRMRNASRSEGQFLATGPSLGVWIYLNALDPSAANNLYVEKRIARTFITAELRNLVGADELVSLSGHAYHFGLRFEL